MARKPRIHYPGAFYHVMLRGNGGQEQREEHLLLTEPGTVLNRDSSALSRAAGRIRERERNNSNLAGRVASTKEHLLKMYKCQA